MIAFVLAQLLSQGAHAADLGVIDQAYQKEYAYLVAERNALQERLQALEGQSAGRVAEAGRTVDATQARLLSLQRQAVEIEEQLAAAERQSASEAAGRDAILAVLGQATASLELEPPAEEAPIADKLQAITSAIDTANRALRDGGSLRIGEGTFFLADGTQVSGTIARAGQVAAWGVSDEGGGSLLPLGAGRLQARPGSLDTARAVLSGARPKTAGVFLFESDAKRVDAPAPPTWADTLKDGGVIGLVILGLGVILGLLAVWRSFSLLGAGSPTITAAEQVARLVREGRLDEARKAAAAAGGAVGGLLKALTRELDRTRDDLEVVAERELDLTSRRLDRFGTAMVVLASVAPLLGLLGTVSGMIATFDVITEFGAGNPKLLSGGISEALVTTQLGLIVAIPGVLVGNLLNGRAREVVGAVEMAAMLVLHEVGRDDDHDDELELSAPRRIRA